MGFLTRLRDRLFGADPPPSVEPEPSPPDPLSLPAGEGEQAPVPPSPAGRERGSGGEGTPDQVAIPAQPADPAVPARQERAASRILEDESLRGDLADDEFQPLLDWALAAADRVAAATAGLTDEAADSRLDERLGKIRESVRLAAEAVAAQSEEAAQRRSSAISTLVQSLGVANPALAGLAGRLAGRSDLSGAELAVAIAKALGDGPEATP